GLHAGVSAFLGIHPKAQGRLLLLLSGGSGIVLCKALEGSGDQGEQGNRGLHRDRFCSWDGRPSGLLQIERDRRRFFIGERNRYKKEKGPLPGPSDRSPDRSSCLFRFEG